MNQIIFAPNTRDNEMSNKIANIFGEYGILLLFRLSLRVFCTFCWIPFDATG